MRRKAFAIIFVLFCSFAAFAQQAENERTISPAKAKKAIAARAKEVIAAIKAKDMNKLASFVHPTKGVRFTPYAYIDTKSDLVFKREQIKSLLKSTKKHNWGEADGSGDPLKLTFANYYKQFVYDIDFAAVRKISYNEKVAPGNSQYNGREIYPDSVFVEYYFGGTNRHDFMDWKALYLTFEKYRDSWVLINISHNQWTI